MCIQETSTPWDISVYRTYEHLHEDDHNLTTNGIACRKLAPLCVQEHSYTTDGLHVEQIPILLEYYSSCRLCCNAHHTQRLVVFLQWELCFIKP